MQALFDVQDLDTLLAQLRHRRETLEARDKIAEGEKVIAAGEARLAEVGEQRHELQRRQKRVEDDLASVEAKAAGEQEKLYSGAVTAIKELQALQDEIAALGRRQSDLEDEALGFMEEAEPIDAQLAELEAERDQVVAAVDALRSQLAAEEAEIDGEIADTEAKRAEAADQVPQLTLADYDKARISFGSRTVVHFDGSDCTGCPLSMPAMEADRVKHEPEGSLLNCNECGRIVAR